MNAFYCYKRSSFLYRNYFGFLHNVWTVNIEIFQQSGDVIVGAALSNRNHCLLYLCNLYKTLTIRNTRNSPPPHTTPPHPHTDKHTKIHLYKIYLFVITRIYIVTWLRYGHLLFWLLLSLFFLSVFLLRMQCVSSN